MTVTAPSKSRNVLCRFNVNQFDFEIALETIGNNDRGPKSKVSSETVLCVS